MLGVNTLFAKSFIESTIWKINNVRCCRKFYKAPSWSVTQTGLGRTWDWVHVKNTLSVFTMAKSFRTSGNFISLTRAYILRIKKHRYRQFICHNKFLYWMQIASFCIIRLCYVHKHKGNIIYLVHRLNFKSIIHLKQLVDRFCQIFRNLFKYG